MTAATRLYLAGPYGLREVVDDAALQLEHAGYTIASRWHGGVYRGVIPIEDEDADLARATEEDDEPPEGAYVFAERDLRDLEDSEAFVYFQHTTAGKVRGGRHVEFGYMLKASIPLYIVGRPENIFHRLPEVTIVANVGELIAALEEQA